MRFHKTPNAARLTPAYAALLGLVLLAPGALASAGPPEDVSAGQGQPTPLSLEDAISRALENNLDVQISRLARNAQGQAASAARRVYTPNLVLDYGLSESLQPAQSALDGATESESDNMNYNLRFEQFLPFGTQYSVRFDNNRLATNSVFFTFNPRYRSVLNAQVSQPLLQNFGTDPQRRQIVISQNGERQADHEFERSVLDVLGSVENAYWDLVFAIRSHEVARQSLSLAQDLLNNNRVQVEVGTMAPIDVLQAEAEVAAREEELIIAEATIRQAEDGLKALIRDPDSDDFWVGEIRPSDSPTIEDYEIDAEEAIRVALQRRPELRSQRVQMETNDYDVRYFRNQTLPAVDLVGNIQLTGVGGTQILRDNIFGPTTGTIPGGYGDALSQIGEANFRDWQVALSVSYPIGPNQAHANHAQAQIDRNRQRQTIRLQEIQITQEVRDAVRQVETNRRRIDASQVARELEERRLDAEQKKFEVGMTTSYFVVQTQRDLAQARAAELQATIDYIKAIVAVERARGTLGDRSRVSIRP